MKITIAQLNPIVGDVKGNLKRALDVLSDHADRTDLIVFSELFLTGYPPRDLLEKHEFVGKTQGAIGELVAASKQYPDMGILIGAPMPVGDKKGNGLYNSAILVAGGKIVAVCNKTLLPSYDVFDETRYFEPSPKIDVVSFKGNKLGISLCEDMWSAPGLPSTPLGTSWPDKSYHFDPIDDLAQKGATVLINISASPFHAGKDEKRFSVIQNHAKEHNIPFLFVNQVGGNDELIFDGRSMCFDSAGELITVFPSLEEHVETVDIFSKGTPGLYAPEEKIESVYRALLVGIRDYMKKCGFTKAAIGLSGGIDSAVTCVLAKEAIGSENILGISMPSEYSAKESEEYSRVLAKNLDVRFEVVPISGIYDSYANGLKKELGSEKDKEVGVWMQNIQARIRGNILMAFSNKFGHLLLTTGNKSEVAVGYCTLYGDMAGGLAVISDVPKTMVYELAGYINRDKEVIPQAIIDRPPSAELKPNQLDQDTLPEYDILDKVLYHYLEEGCSEKEILDKGLDPQTVKWVINAVNRNEYKRRQSPPGLKVTSKAFGIGRRMPIAAKY